MRWLIILTACVIALADGLATARPGPDSNYNVAISGGGGSFSLTVGNNVGSATAGTTSITYTGVSWGSGCNAAIFEISWYNSASTDTISSISGVTGAAQVAGVFSSGGNGQQSIDIWQVNSPSGTSASLTITYSANVTFNSNVTAYCLVSAHTTASDAQHGTAGACNGAAPISKAVTVPASGAGIAMASNASGTVVTWTNATSDTGSPYTGGGTQDAWAKVTGTGTVTVTATPGGSDNCTLGLVAYGP